MFTSNELEDEEPEDPGEKIRFRRFLMAVAGAIVLSCTGLGYVGWRTYFGYTLPVHEGFGRNTSSPVRMGWSKNMFPELGFSLEAPCIFTPHFEKLRVHGATRFNSYVTYRGRSRDSWLVIRAYWLDQRYQQSANDEAQSDIEGRRANPWYVSSRWMDDFGTIGGIPSAAVEYKFHGPEDGREICTYLVDGDHLLFIQDSFREKDAASAEAAWKRMMESVHLDSGSK